MNFLSKLKVSTTVKKIVRFKIINSPTIILRAFLLMQNVYELELTFVTLILMQFLKN